MTINADYSTPVTVNGFACRNCTDVDYAKKHIDPAHPKDGPFGIDAKDDVASARPPAVRFGGVLADRAPDPPAIRSAQTPDGRGGQVDVFV